MRQTPYSENGHIWRRVTGQGSRTVPREECTKCRMVRHSFEATVACRASGDRPVFGVTPAPEDRQCLSWKERQ